MPSRPFRFLIPALSVIAALGVPAAPVEGQSLSEPEANRAGKDAPDSFSALSKRLMPAVVNITTRKTVAPEGLPSFPEGSPLERFNPFFGRDEEGYRQEGSLGSGFVISPDGLVVTNDHVIKEADEINAIFSDGETRRAEIIGSDPETDVAVLQLEDAQNLAYVEFGDSAATEVGDWVIAIGNPFGFGGSVSAGIVSARNRETGGRYDDFIQTDAAINRGNSGGPLFNLDGEVIGVNTAIISPTGGSVGIGFAIPSNMVRRIATQLAETGELNRGWLGVSVQGIDSDIAKAYGVEGDDGIIITKIEEDSPAAAADIQIGDLVRVFNGEPVTSVKSLTRLVAQAGANATVEVELVRERRTRTISVTLGELETAGGAERDVSEPPELAVTDNAIGVEFAPLSEQSRRRYDVPSDISGVLVNSISPRGPAFGVLRKGDVILEMDFDSVDSVSAAVEAMDAAAATPDTPLLVRIWRGGAGGYYAFFSITPEPTS